MNILMIYPEFPETFWSFKYALKFINKKVNNPPLGLLTISPLLPNNWHKKLVDTNLFTLTEDQILWADMVFISAMDVQRESTNKIIKKVKSFKKTIIAGGPLFTGEYSSFPDVDHFILNEAEITLPIFLDDFLNGHQLRRVYSTNDFADITKSPLPDISLINIHDYECMSVQFSRGCPFRCDFCNVTALLGHTPRLKTVDQVISELDQLYKAGYRRNVFFVDDNFIGNKKYLKEEVLPALIFWRKNKKGFTFITETSINLADDDELLELMSRAGFTTTFIGIESPNENSLVECNKKQNTRRDLVSSINKIHDSGIQVMGGFIIGFDSDTPAIFDEMINFIQQSGIVTAMVGILQAPYGTELYERLLKENRILREMSGDNADGTTNIITKIEPELIKKGYRRVIDTIYSPEYIYPRIKTLLDAYRPADIPSMVYFKEIFAFLKTIYLMGFHSGEARYYWNLIFRTLRKYPKKFALCITLLIYSYHFRRVNENNKKKIELENPIPVDFSIFLQNKDETIKMISHQDVAK